MLRTSEAIRLGIHPRTFYSLRDRGEIESVGRGLYRLTSAKPLANPDWAVVAAKTPRATICLISALSYHRLTSQVPHTIDIALPSHSRVPRLDYPPIRVFWFSEPAFSSGVEVVTNDGVKVRIYSPEKTIVDCFKYRNKIGIDVAIEALKSYRERTGKSNLKMLIKFAEIERVQRIMRPYLEATM
jgi:predicted transcriptional regulator of viral defense system